MKYQPQNSTEPLSLPLREGKRELFLEGHETNLYLSSDPDYLIQEYKSNGHTNGKRSSKKNGLLSLRGTISSYLFEHIDGFQIPTHFVRRLSNHEMLVRKLEMIPIFVKVYNFSVGTIPERFGIKESTPLEFPIFEYYLRSPEQKVTWVNEHHLYALGIATPEECKQINRLSSKVNAVLRALSLRRKLALVELQLEFGRYKGQIYLGDDLSPKMCKFGDVSSDKAPDIYKFYPNGEDTEAIYAELLDRLSLKI